MITAEASGSEDVDALLPHTIGSDVTEAASVGGPGAASSAAFCVLLCSHAHALLLT